MLHWLENKHKLESTLQLFYSPLQKYWKYGQFIRLCYTLKTFGFPIQIVGFISWYLHLDGLELGTFGDKLLNQKYWNISK